LLRLTLPPKTTEALGQEAATELAQWFAKTISASRDDAVTRDEFREVLTRLDIIEHDLTGVKQRLDTIDIRLEAMEERFDARLDRLQSEMNARFDAVNGRFDTVNSRFDAMEERLDARFDAMEERFDARFDRLQSDMNLRLDRFHEVVRSQTRWLVATLIAMGGLISVLITIFQFIK